MADDACGAEGRCSDGDRPFAAAEGFLRRYEETPPNRRSRAAADAPLDALRRAALAHPDPFLRRHCISFLDHHANEVSTSVFARALADPVDLVRNMALHSITCETCRAEDLCATDIVPHLVGVLERDASVELRHKAIPLLLRLADADPRAREAVERAREGDPDAIVREVARRGLAGEHIRARRTYERVRAAATRRARLH